MPKHDPIRCFQGYAQPHEPFWTIRNAAETGGDPEIEFYGVISEYYWFDDDITPGMFKDDLYKIGKGGPITLRIHSPGGAPDAASAIRSMLATYPGFVTARIDGLCASAATLVALGANKIQIQDTGTFMIHEPWLGVLFAMLTLDTLQAMTNTLQQTRNMCIEVYGARTGISAGHLKKMLHDETWMTAHEAVEMGFADEVLGPKQESSKPPETTVNNFAVFNLLRSYKNVPEHLKAELQQLQSDRPDFQELPITMFKPSEEGADSPAVTAPALDVEREAQALRDYVQLYK